MDILGEPTAPDGLDQPTERRLREGVVHDLRNPLSAVVRLAESINEREVLTPDGRAELAGLLQAAKGTLRRTEDLASATGEPPIEILPGPTPLREVVALATRHIGYPSSIVQWEPRDGDPTARVDRDHFRRALEHLLANVRRYGGGTASVMVQCGPDGLNLEVGDRGAGSADFEQGHGLQYVQHVVEQHGGTIDIGVRPTGGIIIRTTWPVEVELREDPSIPDLDAESPLNVYVADDEALVRKALARLLRMSGYLVQTFDSGDAMLEALDEVDEVPDVVICDADMPGTHGLDVLAQIRLTAPSAARVLYTAYQPTGRVVEAFNKGAVQRFIRKGQDAAEIEACLAGLAEERKVLGTSSPRRDKAQRVEF